METKMKIETKLSLTDYIATVDSIADGYFVGGEYKPHMGLIHAMGVFYNVCVQESKYDEEFSGRIISMAEMEVILSDSEFEAAFHAGIEIQQIRLDFANAMRDALDIVNTQKSSVGMITDTVQRGIERLSSLAGTITPEQTELLKKIVGYIQDGTLDVDKLLETYGQSALFKKLMAEKKASNIGSAKK